MILELLALVSIPALLAYLGYCHWRKEWERLTDEEKAEQRRLDAW